MWSRAVSILPSYPKVPEISERQPCTTRSPLWIIIELFKTIAACALCNPEKLPSVHCINQKACPCALHLLSLTTAHISWVLTQIFQESLDETNTESSLGSSIMPDVSNYHLILIIWGLFRYWLTLLVLDLVYLAFNSLLYFTFGCYSLII